MAWIPRRGPRGRAGVEGACLPTHPLPCPQAWGRERPQRDTASLRAWLELQKMDRNQDGVVTIDEFLETCQKVGSIKAREPLGPAPASALLSSDFRHPLALFHRSPSEGTDVGP